MEECSDTSIHGLWKSARGSEYSRAGGQDTPLGVESNAFCPGRFGLELYRVVSLVTSFRRRSGEGYFGQHIRRGLHLELNEIRTEATASGMKVAQAVGIDSRSLMVLDV